MEQAVVDNDVGVKTDRLSELPIEVMQHILSFLPTKQVFQSTLLSTAGLVLCLGVMSRS